MNLYKYLATLIVVACLSQIAVYAVHPTGSPEIITHDAKALTADNEPISYRNTSNDESLVSVTLSVVLGVGVAGAVILGVVGFIALSPIVGLSLVGGLCIGLITSGVFALVKSLF